ncbi:MAG: SpoIIE family protein phosphatase [Prevotella sp.]|nr:SpoIIE family protein phosphatase [Prevotella sp.]
MKRLIPESLRHWSSLAIIITAGVLVEATTAVQYYYAKEGIRQEVEHRAQSELKAKSLEIRNVMNVVEVAVENMAWAVEQRLSQPDSMVAVTQKLLADNEYIVGSAVAFEPYYYQDKGRQFSPYTYKHDGTTTSKQLGTDQYDYHSMEWYTAPMESGHGHWSEPYFDEGGGEMIMSTYSLPIHDAAGRCVAIFTADVSLDWLSEIINAHHIYPSSYNLLLSRKGQIMVCPEDSLVMRKSIGQVTEGMADTTFESINRQMMAGRSGQATVTDAKGDKNYVFYAQMDGDTGWSMAVVCADDEIYHSLRWMAINVTVLMLVGLILLAYIIWRAARNARRLQAVNAEKERIGSELHIASAIQMGMLPKTFPTYPDREDVQLYGSLTPAKEVGGDLFDFFIRDEKLFFCIGDVSGKGVPASLVMAVTRSLFRSVSAHESMPDRIVSSLNESMADMNETNMFVTLFVGVLDLPTGRLRYCNAGHDAPLLIGDRVGMLPVESNIPVAVMSGWKFISQEAHIFTGTTIFLFTDGLTEAENASHAQFRMERVEETARQALAAQEQVPKQIIQRMGDAVHHFVGGAEQSDDLTMLAIQYIKQQRDIKLRKSIVLSNDTNEVPRLAAFVDEVCEALGFNATVTMQMNLAIEEAVVNVMEYAYPRGTRGDVSIEAQSNDVRLKFTITDSGSPFDPTAKADADTSLNAEERPIGGLGIHLVRQLMDSINYERVDGHNVLTLRKKLNHQ